MRSIGYRQTPWGKQVPLIWLGACLGFGFAVSAWGDVLEFRAGGTVELPTTIEGDRVTVAGPERLIVFDHGDFRSIEARIGSLDEWRRRSGLATHGTSDERHETACWALDHGLVDEAAALWREVHGADPAHEPSARIVRTLDRLGAERPDPETDSILRLVPADFVIERGPHVAMWHLHDAREAADRVALLERVLVAFYVEFARQGIELQMPTTRLPSIWFPERTDYLKYLDREGADAFRTTRGFHHPTRGLVAMYDARSDDDQRRGRNVIAARRAELDEFRRRIEQAPAAARIRVGGEGSPGRALPRNVALEEVARLGRDLDRRELLLDLDWQRLDAGTAVHELVHQLVTRSGLAPRYAAFPIWLHEGLAMQFETFEGARWAGLGTPAAGRLKDWNAITPAPPLASLLRDAELGSGYRRDPYAMAWAWVDYLRTEQPDAWIALLDGLRLPELNPGPATERARESLKASLNGFIPDWERDWHQYLRERSDSPTERTDDHREKGDAVDRL